MKIEEGRESIDVCLAIQQMREEAKKSFMTKYNKSAKEIEELMKVYWK